MNSATNSKPVLEAPPRRPWLALLAVLVAVAVGIVGFYVWRRVHHIDVPEIATNELDPDVASAIADARRGVIAEPKSAAAWGQVGLVLFANDLYKLCCPWFEQAEKLDPKDPRWPYYLSLALVIEQPVEALGPLNRAVEKKPRDPYTRLRLAEVLMTLVVL